MPATASEMTYGTKMRTRMMDCPRIFLFSSSANAIAIGPCMTSDRTRISMLCVSAPWNSGSWKMMT